MEATSHIGDGLVEPVERTLLRLLRRATHDHAISEHRRHHPAIVHVGLPGGREQVVADRPEDPTDHALRTDMVAAMRRRSTTPGTTPLVWLTRPGELVLEDVDAAWLTAALAAYAEAGVPLVFVVVNRHGWWDPRTGTRRSWKRLRRR